MINEIKPLKALQPLGKLQRKILFVMIHCPAPNTLFELKQTIREIADFLYGKNKHTPVSRKIMKKALMGLRRRHLTDYVNVSEYSHMVGQWWLTTLGRDLNVAGMVHYWKEKDPAWLDEVISRLPLDGFFKTLSYEVDP